MAIDVEFIEPETPPSSTDAVNFRTRADTFVTFISSFVTKLIAFVTQLNNTEASINAKEASAVAASAAAISAANYKGVFVQGTSSALVGESWSYDGVFYRCNVDTTDSPSVEPASWSVTSFEFLIHAATSKATLVDADEFGFWDSVSNTLKKVSFANLYAFFDARYRLKTTPLATGIRQTIQTGLRDANGCCAITTTSADLTLTLLASTDEPVSAHAWGGAISKDRFVEIVANMTLSIPASAAAVYCYINIDENNVPTLGYTLLAPIYQDGGTISMVDGQFTCDISAGKCYVGISGTSYVQVWRVFFQESVTSVSAITAVKNYALNGIYDSGYTSPLPSTGSHIVKNSNLGVEPIDYDYHYKCIDTDAGYSIGEIFKDVSINIGNSQQAPVYASKNTIGFRVDTYTTLKGTSTATNLNGAKWAYKLTAKRGF